MKEIIEFETPLSNYYGTVSFRKENEEYSIFLANWDDVQYVEISKELFDEAKKLFVK